MRTPVVARSRGGSGLLLASVLLSGGLTGCVSTVAGIVTAPVRVAGKAADWATTSQSESDRNRGRAVRHREERLGKLDRLYRESRRACESGDRAACERARAQYAKIEASMPGVPVEPR